MQQHPSNSELVMPGFRQAERHDAENERWSTPVAAAFVVTSSAVLWMAIFAIGRLLFFG